LHSVAETGCDVRDRDAERRLADRLDRGKLAKILDRLASPYDGEALAAGRAANRLIRNADLTWPQVVGSASPAAEDEAEPEDPIGFCLDRGELLTDWERQFLASVRRQPYPLTSKQSRVLRRLVGKCWGAAP